MPIIILILIALAVLLIGVLLIGLFWAVVFAIAPALVGAAAFAPVSRAWGVREFKQNSALRKSLSLSIDGGVIRWHLPSAELPPPIVPLAVLTALAGAVLLVEYAFVAQGASYEKVFMGATSYDYQLGGLALDGVLCLLAPFLLPIIFREKLASWMREIFEAQTPAALGLDMSLVQEIVEADRSFLEIYRALDLAQEPIAYDNLRDLLIDGAGAGDINPKLANARDVLLANLAKLRECARIYRTAFKAYDDAKAAVWANPSPALIEKLDQVRHELTSGKVRQEFEDRDWPRVTASINEISAAIGNLTRMAAGGAPQVPQYGSTGDMPTSLEDVYRMFGIRPGTEKKHIKKTFEGLRWSWRPDDFSDEADRKARTIKTQQINVAWDIVEASRLD